MNPICDYRSLFLIKKFCVYFALHVRKIARRVKYRLPVGGDERAAQFHFFKKENWFLC